MECLSSLHVKFLVNKNARHFVLRQRDQVLPLGCKTGGSLHCSPSDPSQGTAVGHIIALYSDQLPKDTMPIDKGVRYMSSIEWGV
jgi:hypothetical protein